MLAGKFAIWTTAIVLASSVALTFRQSRGKTAVDPGTFLAAFLPRTHSVSTDLPLGSTEIISAITVEKMGYDHVFHRRFDAGKGVFSTYVAHWFAGSRPPSFVASHTPDRCWTLNGMECVGRETGVRIVAGEVELPRCEWRRFRDPSGGIVEVWYWHLVGGVVVPATDIDPGTRPLLPRAITAVTETFSRPAEQYFIRIVSSTPLLAMQNDPLMIAVLRDIAQRLGRPQ